MLTGAMCSSGRESATHQQKPTQHLRFGSSLQCAGFKHATLYKASTTAANTAVATATDTDTATSTTAAAVATVATVQRDECFDAGEFLVRVAELSRLVFAFHQ